MFQLGLFIGCFSHSIFLLGVFGLLYKHYIFAITIVFLFALMVFFVKQGRINHMAVRFTHGQSRLFLFLLFILFLQGIVNFIAALGPELAFDALWYHLTLPKLFLQNHAISFIPGGLLYYSVTPKLTEMLYIVGLAFGNEILPKLIHFFFGILCLLTAYSFARLFVSPLLSILLLVILYANLVFAWESTTAYIDLARTWYELLALFGLFLWFRLRSLRWFFLSALCIGFAIATKVLAMGSLILMLLLIVIHAIHEKKSFKTKLLLCACFASLALLVPLPWFAFAFVKTGNPVYPFFSSVYPVSVPENAGSLFYMAGEFWKLFTKASDPIHPVYLMVIPLALMFFQSFSFEKKLIFIYCLLSLFFWYLTPRTGGGRFILPYLPLFSVAVVLVLEKLMLMKSFSYRLLYQSFFYMIVTTAFLSVVYRGIANSRNLGVVLGLETKESFLANHLNFSFGDFYDVDGYFKRTIQRSDTVLLIGFHNLYYVDFPYVDESWAKKGDRFTYVAVQRGVLPQYVNDAKLVYANKKTGVKLYKVKGKQWVYY